MPHPWLTVIRSWSWNKRTGRNRRTSFAPSIAEYTVFLPATATDWRYEADDHIGQMTIDILPDDVLLEVFDFLVVKSNRFKAENWWHTLVHVCRRWRNLIFWSSHRLNLRLVCSDRTHVMKMLDLWPPLPIVIHHSNRRKSGGDNIIAALEHNDRVCQITLELDSDLQWEKVLDAMQKPFPALTHLVFSPNIEIPLVVPDSFIGGSATRLQYLKLGRVPIPGLPKLLLSATDLVHLKLWRIPHSGYISPEAMVTCLSTLPRLEELYLIFQSPQSRPNRESRRLPPPTRSILPALIKLQFVGVSEYLEDFVARIDSPLLDRLEIRLFHQLIFDTPQLIEFISRTPKLEVHDEAQISFSELNVQVTFPKPSSSRCHLSLQISCEQPEWQLSSMAQICASLFSRSSIHMVERLYIRERSYSKLEWQDDIEGSQWLEVLDPFTAVKNLYLSKEFGPRIAPSLQEIVGGMTTEVLPALQMLCLEKLHPGPFKEAIEKFVAARQFSNHPVAISLGKFVNL
jgi:F-box-like